MFFTQGERGNDGNAGKDGIKGEPVMVVFFSLLSFVPVFSFLRTGFNNYYCYH